MKETLLWGLLGAMFGGVVASAPAVVAFIEWLGRDGGMQWGTFLTLTLVPGALVGAVVAAVVSVVRPWRWVSASS